MLYKDSYYVIDKSQSIMVKDQEDERNEQQNGADLIGSGVIIKSAMKPGQSTAFGQYLGNDAANFEKV